MARRRSFSLDRSSVKELENLKLYFITGLLGFLIFLLLAQIGLFFQFILMLVTHWGALGAAASCLIVVILYVVIRLGMRGTEYADGDWRGFVWLGCLIVLLSIPLSLFIQLTLILITHWGTLGAVSSCLIVVLLYVVIRLGMRELTCASITWGTDPARCNGIVVGTEEWFNWLKKYRIKQFSLNFYSAFGDGELCYFKKRDSIWYIQCDENCKLMFEVGAHSALTFNNIRDAYTRLSKLSCLYCVLQEVISIPWEWDQGQKEAMVDLLLVSMYSKDLLWLIEQGLMENEPMSRHWKSTTSSFNGYLQSTFPKIRVAKDNRQSESDLLQNIARRLRSDKVKRMALEELLLTPRRYGLLKGEFQEEFLSEVKSYLDV